MMRYSYVSAWLLLIMFVSGCATATLPREEIKRALLHDQHVKTAGLVMAERLAPYCTKQVGWTGLAVLSSVDVQNNPYTDVFIEGLGLEPRLNVMAVQPGSPAAQAGVVRGDTVVALNGEDLTKISSMSRVVFLEKVTEIVAKQQAVELGILTRQGQRIGVILPPKKVCALHVVMETTRDHIPTYLWEELPKEIAVSITGPLFSLFKNDDDLDFILTSAVAHVELQQAKVKNAVLHGSAFLLGGISAALTPIVGIPLLVSGQKLAWKARELSAESHEIEADAWVALVLATHTQYDIKMLSDKISRLFANTQKQYDVFNGYHPVTEQRLLALRKLVAEIEQAKLAGNFETWVKVRLNASLHSNDVVIDGAPLK